MNAAAHRKLEESFAALLRNDALGIFNLAQISVGAARQQVICIVE